MTSFLNDGIFPGFPPSFTILYGFLYYLPIIGYTSMKDFTCFQLNKSPKVCTVEGGLCFLADSDNEKLAVSM